MKKLSILLLASVLMLSANTALANCGKKDCKDCKKKEAKHKCNKECMKDGKCAEMKETKHKCTKECMKDGKCEEMKKKG